MGHRLDSIITAWILADQSCRPQEMTSHCHLPNLDRLRVEFHFTSQSLLMWDGCRVLISNISHSHFPIQSLNLNPSLHLVNASFHLIKKVMWIPRKCTVGGPVRPPSETSGITWAETPAQSSLKARGGCVCLNIRGAGGFGFLRKGQPATNWRRAISPPREWSARWLCLFPWQQAVKTCCQMKAALVGGGLASF